MKLTTLINFFLDPIHFFHIIKHFLLAEIYSKLIYKFQQRPQSRPPIRSNISQQSPATRPSTPNQQQIRISTPNQNQSQMRATSPAQGQIRTPNSSPNQNQSRATAPTQQPPIRQLNLNQAQLRNLSPSFQAIRQTQGNLIRAASPGQPVRTPVTIRTPNQQFRAQNSNAIPVRQPNIQVRQSRPAGQVNQPRLLGQQVPRSVGPRMTSLNQIQQLQQKAANNQAIDLNELDIVSIKALHFVIFFKTNFS